MHSVEALAHSNKRDLNNMKGLSEAKVDKMQKECRLCGWHLLKLDPALCQQGASLQHSSWCTWVLQQQRQSWSKERTTSGSAQAAKNLTPCLKVPALHSSSLFRLCFSVCLILLSCRGHRDWIHHRGVRGVQMWQDTALSHSMRQVSGQHCWLGSAS